VISCELSVESVWQNARNPQGDGLAQQCLGEETDGIGETQSVIARHCRGGCKTGRLGAVHTHGMECMDRRLRDPAERVRNEPWGL